MTNETQLDFQIKAVKHGSGASSGIVLGTATPGVSEFPLINNSSAGFGFVAERTDGKTMATFTGENLLAKVHYDVECMK